MPSEVTRFPEGRSADQVSSSGSLNPLDEVTTCVTSSAFAFLVNFGFFLFQGFGCGDEGDLDRVRCQICVPWLQVQISPS